MVNAFGSAVLALLASTAAAQHHHHQHRHLHAKRGDSGSYPMASYPVSVNSTSAAAGTGTAYSTSTTTHTITTTSDVVVYQTMTVEPVPVSPASQSYAATSPAAQASALFSTPAAGLPFCAPVTVTITVQFTSTSEIPSSTPAPASYSIANNTSPAASYSIANSTTPASTSPAAASSSVPVPVYSASSVPVYSSAPAASSAPASYSAAPSPTYKASSAPAATSAKASSYPTAAPPSGGKRGLAYTAASALSGFQGSSMWAWNWNCDSAGLPSGLEYVPIVNNMAQTASFPAAAKQAIASGAKYVMGFNEPDMTTGGGGSQMSPQQAAQAYQTYVMPFAGSAQLGSISVTSNNSPTGNQNGVSPSSGLAYLAEWKEACSGCQVDFVQLHWYGANGQSGAAQAAAFNEYVDSACAQVEQIFGAGTKVWFTEFSALPTLDQDSGSVNTDFMAVALPYLESHPSVERYSYFSASPNLLVNADGSLTKAGQAYTA